MEKSNNLFDVSDQKQYSVYLTDLYTKPWCRIGAYMVGMITGYIIHTYNNKIKMPKVMMNLFLLFVFLSPQLLRLSFIFY